MFAVYADQFSKDDPLSALQVGERPDPEVPDGWATVTVKAASLNHHDLFTLRGIGIKPDRLPIVLGCDGAGYDDETLDPRRSLLSEVHDGTLAQRVVVPRRNLVPKPPELSFEEAACMG